jgi:dTDP-D-glucose 4,6-dehydratase
MENINIKVILDEVFGKSCDSITCDTCKYKEDCELINKFINDIKDKGLSPDHFPKYAKDMIIKIVEANTKINHFIAQHIIDTSNAEYKEITKMANQSVDNNKQENKFKNVSDDEIYAEIKRRKANKSAK